MKHHFANLLNMPDYWTIVPNRERFSFIADYKIKNNDDVRILTITKNQERAHWEQVFNCSNLEELTLHEPSNEQIQAICKLTRLKRIRVTFLRTADIQFISNLPNLEEVVFEYVSGFSDLSPLQSLSKLKSLHLENLRRVSNFDGLKGIESLRYLCVDGTLDWKQPIENFTFLEGLPNLEVLALRFVINKTEYPAFLPILKLKKLKKIRIGMATFDTKEYAFLQAAFSHAPHTLVSFGDIPWKPCYQIHDDYMEFIGKKAGRIKLNNPKAEKIIANFERQYEKYIEEAVKLIKNISDK